MSRSPVRPCPVRLAPVFQPRPWGSRSLAPFFPEMAHLDEPIGEAWMTGNDCLFTGGPFDGKTLGEIWPSLPREWAGTNVSRAGVFPLLVKFLFAEDKLSVQVHPDDAQAALLERDPCARGKTEMWYALRAREGAEVLAGLKPAVTQEIFERAIAEGSAEDCLARVPLHEGDAVFIPAGTAHTIGPGLVLCEIQQQSDFTYRVYDYHRRDSRGRLRPLHIEKALAVMRFGPQRGGKIEPARSSRGAVSKEYLAGCPYFAVEKWEVAGPAEAAASPEHFDLLIFLGGKGSICFGQDRAEYGPAQVWLIPAALDAYRLAPDERTALLRAWTPAAAEEFSRALAEAGIGEAERSRLIHP